MIELLQRSCETQIVPQSHAVEARLLRFARQAAPLVRRQRVQRIVVLASTLVLGTAGTATAALTGGIRIGGVRLSFPQSSVSSPSTLGSPSVSSSDPVAVTLPGSAARWPGEPVTLEEAKSRYKARIRLPKVLRGPTSVFWLVPPSNGQITMAWKPQKDLPKTGDPRVGLLFTQFRGTASGRPVMTKSPASALSSSKLEPVMVSTSPGWFISGPKHLVYISDDAGNRTETARLAGNTLLWTLGEFTYRLEGNFTKDIALRLAKSVQ